jgi:hypothetical protein
VLGGCFPDDWDGQPYQPPTGTVPTFVVDTGAPDPEAEPLVGTWISEGSDISPLFANLPFSYERIQATFRDDGTVTTDIVDADGASYVTSGTWSLNRATEPAVIVLQQTEPYEGVLEGIVRVSGDELTYEVVQVQPDYGYVPPSPEAGFGSTSGPNLSPGVNVQTYVRR